MNTTDFINLRGQQFFLENSINPIEIKIENDTVKNMIEKYKKKPSKIYTWKFAFFKSVQKDTRKFFITTIGLSDAKYSVINEKSTRSN